MAPTSSSKHGFSELEATRHTKAYAAVEKGHGVNLELEQEASTVQHRSRMSVDSLQGLASCHLLASKGVSMGEEQRPGVEKGRPPDSPSPEGMTTLARKVWFIDGKASSALPKIGTD